jgi:hypothetical protein
MKSPEKLYSLHADNLRTVDRGLARVGRACRRAISRGDEKSVACFILVYALLLGAWAECRLRKLLYEPSGFDQGEREAIGCKRTELGRWQAAVELAFRRQYKIPKAILTPDTLDHSAHRRYTDLIDLLCTNLRPVIELRNKLAHGQWAYPLNNAGNDVAQEQMKALRCENLLSLQYKKTLLKHLAEAINDLAVSRPAFERDFDARFRGIVATKRDLVTRNYETYAAKMRGKYLRGVEKRRLGPSGSSQVLLA